MSDVVYPPRDLPGKAEVWGRKVEEVSKNLQKAQGQLSQLVSNSNRSTSGQMAVMAQQIQELTERQTQANTLGSPFFLYGNSSGDVRSYWSPYEFTITQPRGIVLRTSMFASLSVASGDAGSLVSVVGYEPIPGAISTLTGKYNVSTGTLSRLSAGTTIGNLGNEAYLRLGAGTYKLWAGVILSTLNTASYAELIQGVSTLVIGQPLPEGSALDLQL